MVSLSLNTEMVRFRKKGVLTTRRTNTRKLFEVFNACYKNDVKKKTICNVMNYRLLRITTTATTKYNAQVCLTTS
jgi:hypothetical protein